jgi:hypothetical protein
MNTAQAILAAGPACIVIGRIGKAIKQVPDEHIPSVCAVAGAVIVGWLTGWDPESILSGLVAGYSATGMNQQFRQWTGYNNQPPSKPTP